MFNFSEYTNGYWSGMLSMALIWFAVWGITRRSPIHGESILSDSWHFITNKDGCRRRNP